MMYRNKGNNKKVFMSSEPLSGKMVRANLRHNSGGVTESDVTGLPQTLEKLWIGPSFSSSSTPAAIASKFPTGLLHLDLDLTNITLNDNNDNDEVVDDNVIANNIDNDLEAVMEESASQEESHDSDDEYASVLETGEDFIMRTVFTRLPKLKYFCLRLYGDDGAMAVAKSLKYARNLTTLDLRGNHIGDDGVVAIARALAAPVGDDDDCRGHPIENLILSWNHIGSVGAAALQDLLRDDRCPNLRFVDISCNDMLDNAAIRHIANGLRTNTSVREIKLFGCRQVTYKGARHLLACLRDHNMTLHKISMHATCSSSSATCTVKRNKMISILDHIQHYLAFNRAGRQLLRHSSSSTDLNSSNHSQESSCSPPPEAIWAYVLSRASSDGVANNDSNNIASASLNDDSEGDGSSDGDFMQRRKSNPNAVYYLLRQKTNLFSITASATTAAATNAAAEDNDVSTQGGLTMLAV